MPTPDLVSSQEAARLLGVDASTISRAVTAGELVPVLPAPGERGQRYFDRATLRKYAETKRDVPPILRDDEADA